MEARNRALPVWFQKIQNREISLPRFQRHVAWGHETVSDLLTTVLRGLPSGAALVLEVGDHEKFISRPLTGAPENGERITEQLLDGQQRLTALWRSLFDKYDDRTYFVEIKSGTDQENPGQPEVKGYARWERDGSRFPLWADIPEECWKRDLIPLRLLAPIDMNDAIGEWAKSTIPENLRNTIEGYESYDRLKTIINDLRTKVREFNLPFLALPASTLPDVALDVFVKMNTSSVKLTTYDIVVALIEGVTGESLHDHVNNLADLCPRIKQYVDLPSFVLDVAALLQDRSPSQTGARGLDFKRMMNTDWKILSDGVIGLVAFLEEERIFDEQRLPSYTPLPVIAALWGHLPKQPDKLGNARTLLKKYLWRSFLTARYESASNTSALQDFRALRCKLVTPEDECVVPILNAESYPLPSSEMIRKAGWPKSKTILGRGVLALQIKCGAIDFADGKEATVQSIVSKDHPREYHHLFPDSLLSSAGVPDEQIFRSVNCALVTWRTNRTISNKDPLKYLEERTESNELGEDEVRNRLSSHLIPYEEFSAEYDGSNKEKLRENYDAFINRRSEILARAASIVCEGRTLNLTDAFKSD